MEVPIVKTGIESVEWYPVFQFTTRKSPYVVAVQVPEDLIKRYRAALKEFEDVQDILGTLYES